MLGWVPWGKVNGVDGVAGECWCELEVFKGLARESLTEMTLENLKEGEHEPSSYFTMCQGERRTNEMVLITQEHAWCGSRNSKEGSYGWSGVIREESHRRGAESKMGGGGKNNHIVLRGPGLLLCNTKFLRSVEQKKDMVLFTFQFKKANTLAAMLRRDWGGWTKGLGQTWHRFLQLSESRVIL